MIILIAKKRKQWCDNSNILRTFTKIFLSTRYYNYEMNPFIRVIPDTKVIAHLLNHIDRIVIVLADQARVKIRNES